MKWLDRFCTKNERYGIRNLMAIVLTGSAAVWFVGAFGPEHWYSTLVYNPALVLQGEWWRVLTFAFIPPDLSILAVFFFLFYYWIGSTLERHWGKMRFTVFYLSGIIFTIIYGLVLTAVMSASTGIPMKELPIVNIDAQYVNLSLFLAFATIFPDMQIRLFFIIPIKIKWLAIVDLVFLIGPMLFPPYSIASFAPLIALGNYFLFFGGELFKSFKRGAKKATIPFKQTIRNVREQRGYTHKCAVCGVTDTDNPNIEFRYCSLCNGYQCYCSEHIFKHEHKR